MFFAFIGMSMMHAQLKTPAASPSAKFTQEVGLTTITLEYSRPSMKGRAIFGDLVPMDKMWRTGANKNTMITFSTDVTVGGKDLKAGTYAIFTKPMNDKWEVYFYTDTNNWGTPDNWDDSKVAAMAMAKSTKLPVSMESLMITMGNLKNNSAELQFIWENTLASLEIGVPTKEIVTKSIDKVMAGPSDSDYYSAASYYLSEKSNLETALDYINKAIEMSSEEKFWVFRRKALILAELGKYKEASKVAQKSLDLAKAAGNDGYVKMNTESIKMWKKM